MSYKYYAATGLFTHNDVYMTRGYSGLGAGKNNPGMEADHGVGPIPHGEYKIGPLEEDHPNLGPHVMALTPVGHDAHGRTAFFIHGDSVSHPGMASHGCVILDRATRLAIADSDDTELRVV